MGGFGYLFLIGIFGRKGHGDHEVFQAAFGAGEAGPEGAFPECFAGLADAFAGYLFQQRLQRVINPGRYILLG